MPEDQAVACCFVHVLDQPGEVDAGHGVARQPAFGAGDVD
jgi:hypothetical protein